MKLTQLYTSRKNSFFSIITWIFMNIALTMLYDYINDNAHFWSPSQLSSIDVIYRSLFVIIIIIISVHIVSWIFREIEQSFLVDGPVIKRFLPLIKAVTISLMWLIG